MNSPANATPLYEQALRALRERTNFERGDTPMTPARLSVEPMRRLLDRLGRPEEKLRIVHVAGTKGKGSVTWFVDALLRRAGRRCGRYMSPHIDRIEERIALGGRILEPEEFGAAVLEVVPHLEGADGTFFDALTAAAVVAFARAGVEFAAVETGLGGRLDSTNALPKVAAALTSIGLEHTQILGNDVATIAREKAAIARRGVPLFSVSCPNSPEGKAIAAVAREFGAPLLVLGREFEARNVRADGAGLLVDVETVRRTYLDVRLPTGARYQVPNLALAVAIVDDLEARGLLANARAALERAPDPLASDLALPGRFELLRQQVPPVVLDAAHTLESLAALLDAVEETFPGRRRVFVAGFSADKDHNRLSRAFVGRVDTVVVTQAASLRAAPCSAVATALRSAGVPVVEKPQVRDAIGEAKSLAGADGVVVITGSFFVLADARAALRSG
ncbi:MAG: hypothetical protein JNJ88_04315 [Planctomycetes bacterium]|nr:hypothetical protein [Planctomycetota bacterium]